MSLPDKNKLIQFREALYSLFSKRKDAILNLLDALTSHGHQCKSVIQLSNAPCFERQYSSITDAIADGLTEADWKAVKTLVYEQSGDEEKKQPPCFLIDCTPNPRPHAKRLQDRHITHAPNPAPGNKPICVGHQYSVLARLPEDSAAREKHWLLPLSAERVASHQKGNEVGMQQVIDSIDELGLAEELSISVGDTLYSTKACRQLATLQPNLVHIFRLSSNRNLFIQPTDNPDGTILSGRKKEYGDKIQLGDTSTHPSCHEQTETVWVTRTGKRHTVTIRSWQDVLLRGSREFRASQHPLTLIQICVTNEFGEPVFKRPLWLGILGKRRHEITLLQAYQHYTARYDIEHFFRFAKRNLLMNAYQTAEVSHEASWWQLCTVAYMQLYLAKGIVPCLPQPWERYLPEYKNNPEHTSAISAPAKTQRGFLGLLETIGTPAARCTPRGKPRGRMAGDTQIKRETQPIVFKTKKAVKQTTDRLVLGSDQTTSQSNPEKIDTLLEHVRASLRNVDLTPSEFSKLLLDSG